MVVIDQQGLKKKQFFAEDVGLVFENIGLPRMAGRVLGWLLVCDPPHQSMLELVEALSASKASISNTTRMLIEIGLIERISLPDLPITATNWPASTFKLTWSSATNWPAAVS